MTLDGLVLSAAQTLRAAGVESPQREARLLMALTTAMTTADLIARGRESISSEERARFDALVARRAAREPFQHIAGVASFYGHDFTCDARALVPRADSECVVAHALERLPRGRGVNIADLGTGSGCLLIAILLARGGVTGTGVESDARAASLARENLKRHGLTDRAAIAVLRWQDWPDWQACDLIVANPPYVPSAEVSTLEPEVRLFDPRAALDGGEDGLAAYRVIVALAAERMRDAAVLVLETGASQRRDIEHLMRESGFSALQSGRDLAGRDRVVSGVLRKR